MRRPRGPEGKRRQKQGQDDDEIGQRQETTVSAYENHSCLRKKQHTRTVAIVVAGRMTEKTGIPFVVYECPFCGRWHTGKDTAPLPVEGDGDE